METVSIAKEFSSHVIGIDFSGNPTKGSFDKLLPALEYQKPKERDKRTKIK